MVRVGLMRQSSWRKPAHSCVVKMADCWPKLWVKERKQKSWMGETMEGQPPLG